MCPFEFWFFFKNDLLASPKSIGVHTSTPEYASTASISATPPSPKSWFSHVGVHNSIPEYASTASILKLIEKKFLKKWFSPQISSKTPSSQETEYEKKRKKEVGKRKAPRVSSNKKRSQYFARTKNTSTSKILFDVIPFSPPPSYHFKNPFQNYWEIFLNSLWTIL
jgi:hypothetical protein